MKNQFLRELNHKLRFLDKEERKRYLNEYEEIIFDKIENGKNEEKAVSELGSIKYIAKEILNSYTDMNGNLENFNHINKMYVFLDIMILIGSYTLAYYLYCNSAFVETNSWFMPFSTWAYSSLLVIPGYVIIYYLFKLYTFKCVVHNKRKESCNIFIANLLAVMIFFLILYFFKQIYFPRIAVFTFCCINVIFDIFARTFICQFDFSAFFHKSRKY